MSNQVTPRKVLGWSAFLAWALALCALTFACLTPPAQENIRGLDGSQAALEEQRDDWAAQGADTSTLDALIAEVKILKAEVKAQDYGEQTNMWLGLAGMLMGGGAGAFGKFGPSRGKKDLNLFLAQVNREFAAIKAAFKTLEENGSVINGKVYSDRLTAVERTTRAFIDGLNGEPGTEPPEPTV